MTRDDAEAVLAGILREHLSANPELPETAESRRREKLPTPVAPTVEERRPARPATQVASRPATEPDRRPAAPRTPRARASTEVAAQPVDSSTEVAVGAVDPAPSAAPVDNRPRGPELYVNLGRNDGVRPHDVKNVLSVGGIPAEQLGSISVRDRCSFVEVDPSVVDACLVLLNAASIEGKPVQATLSKRSQPG